jgi:hypothetical protein
MKRLMTIYAVLLIAATVFLAKQASAQAPNKMSYQAVIRNSSNALVTNQALGMQISILQTSVSGTSVYTETQKPTTNANGLVSIEIGGGSVVSGNFANINWANGPYFIKTETDPTGGTSYSISGTSQLLSVPYALYAASSGSSIPGPQGPIGLTGPAGATGPQGAIGITGPAGATGPQGAIGLTGPAGATGPQGATGLTGPAGPQGAIGITGPAGATGPQGSVGATGPQGPIGLTGPAGATGPQGSVGATGPQGPIGLTGPAGATGPQGSAGVGGFTHYIGEQFGGGVIYHLWKDAQGVEHGLIADKTDLSIMQTSSNIVKLIGTSAQSSWDGLSNSYAIIGQAGHTGSAAALCLSSTNGGQSDWYLPSIDELSLLWQTRFNVNKTLSTIGGAAILSNTVPYWSSTEYNDWNMHQFDFIKGWATFSNKGNTTYVRAVRAF